MSTKVPPLLTRGDRQFGQTLTVERNPGVVPGPNSFATAAKDLARWKGDSDQDVQPVRIYLGAWEPQPTQVGTTVAPGASALPTPWSPDPAYLDHFAPGVLYARITWGAGGVRHVAYADWHPRGSLVQVSSYYVQVDAVGTLPGGLNDQLPILSASIGPEPGGGDAEAPGTFTYPHQDGAAAGLYFQRPPFARSFTPTLIRTYYVNQGCTSIQWQQIGMGGSVVGDFVYDPTVGSDFPDDRALPLSVDCCGINMVVLDGGDTTARGGMIFQLDM